jgi:uncharacterized membrane protein
VPVFESGREVDRVVFFSDAVFAIAMTLLAFSIRVPVVAAAQTAGAVRHLAGPLLGYVLTFWVLGLYWMAHHRMFRFVERIDSTFITLNLLLLAFIAIMPVPSELLGRQGGTSAAVIFYAVTVSLVGLSMSGLWIYATYHRRLVVPDLSHDIVASATARSLSVPVVFLASIPVAVVSPAAAKYFWLSLILIRVIFRRRFSSTDPAGD